LYAADMRADPAIADLNDSLRYALIQAWDLAKNGPGDARELRGSKGEAMPEATLRALARVSPQATRRMYRRWAEAGLCELREEAGRTLVVFPNLAKRQGIDATAAARKRRERERRSHGDVTEKSRPNVTALSRDVTGENQSTEEVSSTEPSALPSQPLGAAKKQRPRDLVWDALVEACGYQPGTATERGAWNRARKEIGDNPPGEVAARAKAFKRRYPDLKCTPTALMRQWGALGETNGQPRRRSQEEVDRMIAEQGLEHLWHTP